MQYALASSTMQSLVGRCIAPKGSGSCAFGEKVAADWLEVVEE